MCAELISAPRFMVTKSRHGSTKADVMSVNGRARVDAAEAQIGRLGKRDAAVFDIVAEANRE